jgi:hypothetical protein
MLIKKRFPLRLRGDLAPTDRYGTPRALFTPRIFLQVPVRDDSQTTVGTVSSGGNSSTSSEKPKNRIEPIGLIHRTQLNTRFTS